MRRRLGIGVVLLTSLLGVALLPRTSGPQAFPQRREGSTATLLSDGRWLILGGEGVEGAAADAAVWDPRSQTLAALPRGLSNPRAWHSATALPDGTVLLLGGFAGGRVVGEAELFSPQTLVFRPLDGGPGARAEHSATLTTDGQVAIAGGVGADGAGVTRIDLWDPRSGTTTVAPVALPTVRRRHTALLTADGAVALWRGVDGSGLPLNGGVLYQPSTQNLVELGTQPTDVPGAAPRLEASLPPTGATGVPLDARIGLRFSRPLRVDTLNPGTVTLVGPEGPEAVDIAAAEAGRLAFVNPARTLRPGARYALTLNGPTDEAGFQLDAVTIEFTTMPGPGGEGASLVVEGTAAEPKTNAQRALAQAPASGDPDGGVTDEDWIPTARHLSGDWTSGRSDSAWKSLPPLEAPAGTTALAGQVLRLTGEPLASVTLTIDSASARTDATGRFLLPDIAAGHRTLFIDGRTANRPGTTYGIFEVGVDVVAGRTAALPYTIWMPKLDMAHAVKVPSYTTEEVVVTTPRIPGLEVRIPPHVAIRDHEGKPVNEVSITPIPLDRPPFPLPRGVDVPLYFTVQPGGAYIRAYGAGARLIYPNSRGEVVGTRFNFWNYDAQERGWYIYGLGTVLEGAKQVAPDPGVAIYEFSGAMVAGSGSAPPEGPLPGDIPDGEGADPIDLRTGLFVYRHTDAVLPDTIPIVLTRTYRTRDTRSRAFGVGANHPYDMFLVGDSNPYTFMDLILEDGGRVHYTRISPGTSWTDAVYEAQATPTKFYKSRIAWNGNGWDLTTRDGTLYVFPESSGRTRGAEAAVLSIRDRRGNTLVMTRDAARNLTRVTSPNGRFVEFTYDAAFRITQAKDNIGRIVRYEYDASGRLTRVTDQAGGVTEYTYDTSQRMVTIRDARGIVFLTNEYDAAGRVSRQTLADGGAFQIAYTTGPGGAVTQADLTDPRGNVRRLTFDANGFVATATRAVGTPIQQTTTYERQAGTNLLAAVTDPLGRRTAYGYDNMGNLTSLIRLAGTANAVTTTLTYEPTFNQVASVTDPLNHTTTLAYDSAGSLSAITDPLGHQTAIISNPAGQPVTVTTPAGTTQLAYEAGDLVAVTDPLGRTATRFVDGAGRLLAATSPLGQRARYDYDALNRLVMLTDPLGGQTLFTYDNNGNLTTLSDARGGTSAYTYDIMDRLASRRDPVLRTETLAYDLAGNRTGTTDRKGQTTTMTYDALDRLTQVRYADQSTVTYTYDGANRVTQVADSLAGTITRTYDGLDRLVQEATPQGTITYTYDAAGRRTSMTVAGQTAVSYAYDAADRLTQITRGTNIVTLAYDTADRRTRVTLSNGITTDIAYDAASQVSGMTYALGGTTLGTLAYTYDADGTRARTTGTWARTGLPAAMTGATYDAASRQLTFGGQALSYDPNGNLVTAGGTTYTWNARDQLTGITGPGVTASFSYDGLGRRSRQTINGLTADWTHDGLNVVRGVSGTTTASFLNGFGLDEHFASIYPTGTFSFLTDVLGSTVALTNGAGSVVNQYTYEPFGAVTVTGTIPNPFQYTGQPNDGTGLYYHRARYYDPYRQRFINEDRLLTYPDLVPILADRGEMNAYAYVGNGPLNWVDVIGFAKAPPPGQPPSRPTQPPRQPPKRDDFKETVGQPDPVPPPPTNPGMGCLKFFENCMQFCRDRCRSGKAKAVCAAGCFSAWLFCEAFRPR